MTVRWYRGAVVKKQRIKRQKRLRKPKAPSAIPKTKSPSPFRPKSPGVQTPGVSLPFISAGAAGVDDTILGLDAIKYLADRNKWDFVSASWKLSTTHNCTASDGSRSCPEAAASFTGINSWQSLISHMPRTGMGESGIWTTSHPNCSCHINVILKDKSGRTVSFDVYPHGVGNSFEGTGAQNVVLNADSKFNPSTDFDADDYVAYGESPEAYMNMVDQAAGVGGEDNDEEPSIPFMESLAPGQTPSKPKDEDGEEV